MKTNTMTGIVAPALAGSVALAVGIHISANYMPYVAVSVSYFAVVVLLALAAVDYRVGPKSYAAR